MGVVTTVSMSREIDEYRKKYKISASEAFRVGMAVLLNERGISDFNNNINLIRKMNAYQRLAEEATQELNALKEKKGGIKNVVKNKR